METIRPTDIQKEYTIDNVNYLLIKAIQELTEAIERLKIALTK